MAVMFDGTDKIQHQAWPFLDPELINVNKSEWARRMIGHCKEYFRELDAAIRRLVELAGEDAQVFFASDHGFSASTMMVKINSVLHHLGYLAWKPVDDSESGVRREKAWFANLDWQRPSPTARRHRATASRSASPNAQACPACVRASMKSSGKLIADLKTVTDENGRPVFTAIRRREDVYPGPAMREAPDLLLELSDFGFVSISDGPMVQKRTVPVGTHHPEGVFLAYGKGIAKGKLAEPCRVWDVPAMLLHSMGVPTPSDFEGRVASQIYARDYLTANPEQMGPSTKSVEGDSRTDEKMSEQEQKDLIKQLELLGYME